MKVFLDFEQKIAELEKKIEELRHLSDSSSGNIADEISKLQSKADRLLFFIQFLGLLQRQRQCFLSWDRAA